jgi:hypothetical protein
LLPIYIRRFRHRKRFVWCGPNPRLRGRVLAIRGEAQAPVPMPPSRFVMLERIVLTFWLVALPAVALAADVRVDFERHRDFDKYRTFQVEVGSLVRPDGSIDEQNTLARTGFATPSRASCWHVGWNQPTAEPASSFGFRGVTRSESPSSAVAGLYIRATGIDDGATGPARTDSDTGAPRSTVTSGRVATSRVR